MNILRLNRNRSKSTSTARQGLSIIEVLTSIVVAMIGVFGIMVLIPFSVKQSKSGLDKDAGTVLARNALSEMEVRGYRNPDNWRVAAGTAPTPTAPTVFMVDPIFVTENGGAYTPFPFNSLGGFPGAYQFAAASLVGADGADMTLADARRIFVSENELVFGEALDDLTGPEQILDASSDAAVGNIRRQYQGSLSMSVLMVPYKSIAGNVGTAWSYRSYVFIYKNRSVDPTIVESQMFSALVTAPLGPATPVGAVTLDTSTFLPDDYNIAKDDWVMLVNRSTIAEAGFDRQVGFYRVVNYDIDETPGARLLQTVTLDGPDFDFGDVGGTGSSASGNYDANGTHMVHLKDVISIYERNIVPESSSTWNTF